MRPKAGAPVTHEWLREMQIGESYDFQDTIKLNTARCLVYQYSLTSGRKFTVSAKKRTITRIK